MNTFKILLELINEEVGEPTRVSGPPLLTVRRHEPHLGEEVHEY